MSCQLVDGTSSIYQSTRRNISEEPNIQQHRSENRRSRKRGDNTSIKPRPLHSRSFPIHPWPAALSFDAMHWAILTAPVNNPQYIIFANKKYMYVCMYVTRVLCMTVPNTAKFFIYRYCTSCPCARYDACEYVAVYLNPILTLDTMWREWSSSRFGRFTAGKRALGVVGGSQSRYGDISFSCRERNCSRTRL